MEKIIDMKKYKLAATLMIIHGGFMEIGGEGIWKVSMNLRELG